MRKISIFLLSICLFSTSLLGQIYASYYKKPYLITHFPEAHYNKSLIKTSYFGVLGCKKKITNLMCFLDDSLLIIFNLNINSSIVTTSYHKFHYTTSSDTLIIANYALFLKKNNHIKLISIKGQKSKKSKYKKINTIPPEDIKQINKLGFNYIDGFIIENN